MDEGKEKMTIDELYNTEINKYKKGQLLYCSLKTKTNHIIVLCPDQEIPLNYFSKVYPCLKEKIGFEQCLFIIEENRGCSELSSLIPPITLIKLPKKDLDCLLKYVSTIEEKNYIFSLTKPSGRKFDLLISNCKIPLEDVVEHGIFRIY